jgi:hypothetical protein
VERSSAFLTRTRDGPGVRDAASGGRARGFPRPWHSGTHEAPGAASLQVLRGRARLVAGAEVVELGPHQLAPIPPRRHSLHADEDTVVLLTVAG